MKLTVLNSFINNNSNCSHCSSISSIIDLHPYTMEITLVYRGLSYQATIQAQDRAYQDHLDFSYEKEEGKKH